VSMPTMIHNKGRPGHGGSDVSVTPC
jgi:hypothetical protein